MNRREYVQVISSVSVAGLSGCAAIDDIGRAIGDVANEDGDEKVTWRKEESITTGIEYPESDNEYGKLPLAAYMMDPTTFDPNSYHETTINLGEYSDSIDGDAIIEFQVSVEQGPPVDVFFTNPAELTRYESGDRFYISQGSRLNVSYCNVSVLASDIKEYTVIIDHSDIGEASPDGESVQVSSYIYVLDYPN